MNCFIYRSKKKQDFYIYLSKKDHFDVLSNSLKKTVGELEYCFDFDLTEDKNLARENSKTVLANLKKDGFHVQVPPPKHAIVGEFKIKPSLAN